uniref:Glutamate-gated chloride channel n=1 Tax=Acrobeloides nanus TaxID=290746 RepID=A0A914CP50_9BILA
MSNVDEANMAYDIQITFREQWNDSRLAYGKPNDGLPSFIILNKEQDIWRPDTFFANEKSSYKHEIDRRNILIRIHKDGQVLYSNEKSSHRHEIDRPNILIRIHKDGQVLYSVRISLTLSCPMNFQYYPLDVQNCLLDFASYAYTTEDIEYRWKDGLDPVQIKAGVTASLPQFFLKNLLTDTCTSVTNTGSYSCLRTMLKLTRLFGYHLFHVYLPGAMLVIISWVSFWLDPSAVLGRVTLGVATLLTMVIQSGNVNNRLPLVSYIKAIDVWIGSIF